MESDVVHITPEESEGYNRVNTNAQTRLTVSTFLASICLSIFAVFLPNTFHINGLDWGSVLAVVVEALVGGASVLFLIIAASVSIVLTRLGDLDSSTRESLSNRVPAQMSKKDQVTLDNIIKLYDGIYFVNYLGLLALLLSLPIMGFRINVWVGIIIVVALIGVLLYFRKSLGFVIFYKSRKTPWLSQVKKQLL